MLTVRDILLVKGPDVMVATSTTTVLEATEQMAEASVGSMIVEDGAGVNGIFTERDLLQRVVVAGLDPATTLLREVMSSPVASCSESTTVGDAQNIMFEKHIRHLVVEEDGGLVGLIGVRDVLAALLREDEERIEELEHQNEPSLVV